MKQMKRRGLRLNLVGERFGKLEVVSRAGSKRGNALWLCICDCGYSSYVTSGALRAGRIQRCSRCRCVAHRKLDGAFLELYRRYVKNAEKRKLSFELTQQEFRTLVKENCFYCNEKPKQCLGQHAIPFYYNGVDRLTNQGGYTTVNSVPCCGTCNDAKGTLSFQEFINLVRRIVANLELVHEKI